MSTIRRPQQRSAEENSDQTQGVAFFLSPLLMSTSTLSSISFFGFLILIASNSVRNTLSGKDPTQYMRMYVCMCVRLRFLASPAFFYGTRSSNFDLDDCRVQSMKDRRSFTIGRPRIWLALTGAFTASSPVRPNYSPRCRQLVELRPHPQVPSKRT